MTVATDKMATVELIVSGVTDKAQAGNEACSADTVTKCTNIVCLARFNGSHADSTGTRREVLILMGETAPTGEYDNAAPGSLFILANATTGGLYMMTSVGTWQVATFG